MPTINIIVSDNTIEVKQLDKKYGKIYLKGSLRPDRVKDIGDVVLIYHPWWNNQSVIPYNTKWSDIQGNGVTFTSYEDFLLFMQNEVMKPAGPMSVPGAQFTIGDGHMGTPLDGSDTYYNPNMQPTSKVIQNGVGALRWGVDIDFVSGGGFQIIGTQGPFATDQTFLIFY